MTPAIRSPAWRPRSSAPPGRRRRRRWPPTGSAAAAGAPDPDRVRRAGLIARYIHTFLAGTGWSFDEIGVHDLSADSAAGFRATWSSRHRRPGHRARQRRGVDPLQRPGRLRHRRRPAACQRPVVVRAQSAGAARVAARPRAGDPARLDQHRRRRRALPEGQHLTASGRAAHRQPGLPGRHLGRRDGRAGDGAGGSAGDLLALRPRACSTSRSASTSTTKLPAAASCRSSTTSSTSCAGTDDPAAQTAFIDSHSPRSDAMLSLPQMLGNVSKARRPVP